MKKGFTLIELLAVIVILAIILAIAVPSVNKIIQSAQEALYKNDEMAMIKATKTYLGVNESRAPTNSSDISVIELSELQSNNYIGSIIDSKSKEDCTGYVVVTKKNATEYVYNPYLDCGSNYKTYGDYITDGLIVRFDGYDEPQNINGNYYWIDKSGNGNNALMVNMGMTSTSGYNPLKKAYVFDGSNDYMAIASSANLLNPNAVTFEFCVRKLADIPSTTNLVLLSTESYPASGEVVRVDNAGQLILYRVSNGTSAGAFTGSISNNRTYYIAVTRVSGVYKIYVDGVLIKQGDLGKIPATPTHNINIQDQRHYAEHSSVRIYNRALSDEEIQYNYNIDKQRFGL